MIVLIDLTAGLGVLLAILQLVLVRRVNLVPLLLGVLVSHLALVAWAVTQGFVEVTSVATFPDQAARALSLSMSLSQTIRAVVHGGLSGLPLAALVGVAGVLRANLGPEAAPVPTAEAGPELSGAA